MAEQETRLMKIAPVVLSIAGGMAIGYFYHDKVVANITVSAPSGGPPGGGGGGGGARPAGGGGGGGAGGGGGMMGGGQQTSATALPRLIRNLATIEAVQNRGLTAEQAGKISAALAGIKTDDKLSEQECDAKLKAVEGALNDAQKKALESLQPAGRGGGGMGGGGGGMGGGRPDPEHPFASERNKKALEDLTTTLQKIGK